MREMATLDDFLQPAEADPYEIQDGLADYSISARRRGEIIAHALEDGLAVEYGKPKMLQLDLDTQEQVERARSLLSRFGRMLGVERATICRSRSGNFHVRVYLDPRKALEVTREERVLLQAVLGGDPVRALLDWEWARKGGEDECFLIVVPENVASDFEIPPPPPPVKRDKRGAKRGI